MTVYFHHASYWHVVAAAYPGGRITARCSAMLGYEPVKIATDVHRDYRCEECERLMMESAS